MKKRILLMSISILLILGIVLSINNKSKLYIDNKETNNKSLAVYVQGDNGSYNRSTSVPIKDSGYSFNTSLSVCDGSASILWDNEAWGLELDSVNRIDTKCYLYFDKN